MSVGEVNSRWTEGHMYSSQNAKSHINGAQFKRGTKQNIWGQCIELRNIHFVRTTTYIQAEKQTYRHRVAKQAQAHIKSAQLK